MEKMIPSFLGEIRAPSRANWIVSIVIICLFLVAQQQLGMMLRQPRQAILQPQGNSTNADAFLAMSLEEKSAMGIYKTTRHMYGFGRAAYTFVLSGAYRTGPGSFALVGLASKPLHSFGRPKFECEWRSHNRTVKPVVGSTKKFLPDWGFGRVYTVVVVHCNFGDEKATQSGGKLHFRAGTGQADGDVVEMTALEEKPGDFKASNFPGGPGFEFKYDYLYCGSSLYGDLNPNLLGEWLAYHAMVLGPRSHIVLHDVGGLKSKAVQNVLEPWVKAGYVTVYDFTEEANFDGYYHNQFLVVNDCLFRYKHAANWTFFFDVDEYLYIPPAMTLNGVMDQVKDYSQIMFEQNLMGHNACIADGSGEDHSSDWGIEKLVFRNVKYVPRQDRKYVIKASMADSAGVHLSEHIRGKHLYSKGDRMLKYYHYHNTITTQNDALCSQYVELSSKNKDGRFDLQGIPYVYDNGMASFAEAAKAYQRQVIGTFSGNSSNV